MEGFLNTLLSKNACEEYRGIHKNFSWKNLGEGILECIPHNSSTSSIIISAGIHGNETAPIEIIDQIVNDLFSGKIILKEHVLFIFGNPQAIRLGKRYLENDLNRLFFCDYNDIETDREIQRAKELEKAVDLFFKNSPINNKRYHYDLHTAIRTSLFQTFALLPYQVHPYDNKLIEFIESSNIDALVYHNEIGKTFTQFTSSLFLSASVTLELGKANKLGENNLVEFNDIKMMLENILLKKEFPFRKKSFIDIFIVKSSILKEYDDFKFNLPDNAPNFTLFAPKNIIATQNKNEILFNSEVRILFPNNNVKKGLRAGLIIIQK
ncbi:succinylglutamate desuccinylase [Acinetobacter sp. ME22]|uniref:succinylglutamate desuccinylase n=1 Tax=Acinetobacter sp. ME22 TaxID=2904802 RepID=UPI001EDB8590|nr:succinylglutamate desuccinylase [Acinetobacter sp. ME22]MCG2574958.1 succinylglutamate desuccinylase [Acinetobacter sp. ME22]